MIYSAYNVCYIMHMSYLTYCHIFITHYKIIIIVDYYQCNSNSSTPSQVDTSPLACTYKFMPL